MGISNVFTLREIVLTGPASGNNITQVSQRSLNTNLSLAINRAAGDPAPGYVAVMKQEPMISWTTTEIGRTLTNVNYATGLAVGSDVTCTAADFYFAKVQDRGTRQTGSTKMKVATSRGLIVPRILSVQQGGEGTISLEYFNVTTDGSTSPWTISTGQAAGVATPSTDQKWTLGPVTINGTQVNGVQGWSLDFGLTVEPIFADGGVFPLFCWIKEANPIFKIQTNDPVNLSTFGISGARLSSTTKFYMTKIDGSSGVTRVAAGTGEHVCLTAATGHAGTDGITTSSSDAGDCEITVTPTTSGGTFLTQSVTSTIT